MPHKTFQFSAFLQKMFSQLRRMKWMLIFVAIYLLIISCASWYRDWSHPRNEVSSGLYGSCKRDNDVPILFIGGCPRSGTTLMRVLLDSHPHVSCGPETHILPRLLNMYTSISAFDQTRMTMAGIDTALQNLAMRDFILDIILGQVKKSQSSANASFLPCNKDPFLLNNAYYLKHKLFPKAKVNLQSIYLRTLIKYMISLFL